MARSLANLRKLNKHNAVKKLIDATMTSLLQAIILGTVQGITEWLPISSSGHLVLFQELFGINQPVIFDIFLHLGSLLVIFIVFRKEIKKLIIGIFRREKFYLKYFGWLLAASIPIAVVGLFLNDIVKAAFENIRIVGVSLIFTALVLFLSRYPKKKDNKLTWVSVVGIGAAQALALLPGVSRSGMTISSGLMQGIKHEEAVRFSFLLFIPAILGATILEIGESSSITNIPSLLVGILTTVVVGCLSLQWLLKVVKKGKFNYFGWYCLILGLVLMFLM